MATTVPNRSPLIVSPHLYLADVTGRPLDYGRVYFGKPNKDGEFYPIDIFSDKELTKPLAQPVRTKGGFLHNNGDMVEVFAYEGVYSVKVLDQYGRKIFYKAEVAKQTIEDATSDVVDAAQTEINKRMAQLDDTINAAAAAAAGAKGWTDVLIDTGNGRNQRDKNTENISVKDFGAKGDGITNDTTAVQSALSSVQGELFLPRGTYLISTVTVAKDNIVIRGESGTVIKAAYKSNSEGLNKKLFDVTGNNVTFESVTFEMGKGGGVIGAGTMFNYPHYVAYFKETNGVTINNCKVTDGVFGFVTENCQNVRITNNNLQRLERWGIFLEGAKNFFIDSNISENSAYDGIKMSGSQSFAKTGVPYALENGIICNNILRFNKRDGIDAAIDGASNILIFGNHIIDNQIYGIELKKSEINANTLDVTDIHVQSNIIKLADVQLWAILFRKEGTAGGNYTRCSAYDNKIFGKNSDTNKGIWVAAANNVTISNNEIYDVNEGVLVGNSNNCIVKSNRITSKSPVVLQGTGTDYNLITGNFLTATANHAIRVLTGLKNRISNNEVNSATGYYTVEDETSGTGQSTAQATIVINTFVGTTTAQPKVAGRPGDVFQNPTKADGTVAEWTATTHSQTDAIWLPSKYIGAIDGSVGLRIGVESGTSSLKLDPNAITYNRATGYLDQNILGGSIAIRVKQSNGINEPVVTIKAGTLQFNKIPTSSTGLGKGDVWNDAGTLKIIT